MYQRIMVPLDGSELAECVLSHVEAVAKGCTVGNVVFVRVVEPFDMPSGWGQAVGIVAEEQRKMDSINEEAAEKYLKQIVSRVNYGGGVSVQSEVITGRAAESLADYADKNNVDLMVIATHGRSGVSRWVWGSVADRILRSSCVPVLMVRAPGCVPGIN